MKHYWERLLGKVKTVALVLITASFVSSCAFLDKFIADQPPTLLDLGYPELVDVPESSFEFYEDGQVITDVKVLWTLGRNTAACLDKLDQYSEQISTYNKYYGK